jgi:hypothetical protein
MDEVPDILPPRGVICAISIPLGLTVSITLLPRCALLHQHSISLSSSDDLWHQFQHPSNWGNEAGYICFPVASIVSSYASFSSLISPASATNVSFPS